MEKLQLSNKLMQENKQSQNNLWFLNIAIEFQNKLTKMDILWLKGATFVIRWS